MAGSRNILLFGATGQVGWELQRALSPLGAVRTPTRAEADLARPDRLAEVIRGLTPDLIVIAAAYTAVDGAENADQRTVAEMVNATAPGIIAEEAKRIGAAVVHYSTDYVFDGERPLRLDDPEAWYREDDATGPLNVYGRTKLAGEQAILATDVPALIFRTSWVYASHGKNFLRTVLALAAERDSLSMVADQHGAPTWARHIAQATAQAIGRWGEDGVFDPARRGVYHMTAAGHTTWHGFATAILRRAADSAGAGAFACTPEAIHPIPAAAFPAAAARPKNSLLCNDKLRRTFGLALPHWETGLAECLPECLIGPAVPDSAC